MRLPNLERLHKLQLGGNRDGATLASADSGSRLNGHPHLSRTAQDVTPWIDLCSQYP